MKILIFAYNTNFGVLSSVKKFFKSEPQVCHLFNLTVAPNGSRRRLAWDNFIENLSYHKIFFDKKHFSQAHPEFSRINLPLILIKEEDVIRVLIDSDELNSLANTDDLIGLMGKKLSGF